MDEMQPLVLNVDKMRELGVQLLTRYEQYRKDRYEVEQQWLKNLRQFRGIIDPTTESNIPADQSKAYPKITRTKIIGTVSRLMEMLFPQTEKNWSVVENVLPDLSVSDLQLVLDLLTKEWVDGGKDPAALGDEDIERAIKSFASEKARRMSEVMEDQLNDLEYIDLARRVIFSAVLYSAGILKGPMVLKGKRRTWTRDPNGQLKAKLIDATKPFYEFVSVWEWYPDLSSKTFEQMDGSYFRHIMSRNQVRDLASRPDFLPGVVESWLSANPAGNYKELHWEQEMRIKGDRKNAGDLAARKYELWEWWGGVSGHDLRACGVSIPDDKLSVEYEANVWGIGNLVIKCRLNPYDKKIRPHHIFIYEEDDINLLGIGLPQVMRDSALAIGEATRMLLDNASVVCGPMLEINEEMMIPGQTLSIAARRIFLREGLGPEASSPAVRPLTVNSHIPELRSVIELFMNFADTETALPPSALGDVTQGGSEALRTQGNLSMLMGAASLPIRDTVRNFDHFTVSLIGSLYYWNMQFHLDESIKGDFLPLARGSTSLIAKEVRAIHLDQFVATLTPEERMYLDTRKTLVERMKVRDLPTDLLEDKETVDQRLNEQAATAAATAQQQTEMIRSEIRANIAGAFKDFALALKANTQANVETFDSIVGAIADEDQRARAGTKKGGTSS